MAKRSGGCPHGERSALASISGGIAQLNNDSRHLSAASPIGGIFLLRTAHGEGRTSGRKANDPYAQRVAHVLVVEDDLTVAEVVVTYLRHAGLEATHVADGGEAVSAFEATKPDLVVLDLMLPNVDGLEVCRRLRALDPPYNNVPVVMLTAMGQEEDRVAGLVVGADDYVTKPFSPRELVLRVQSVLRRSTAVTEAADEDQPAETLEDDDLTVDVTGHRVFLGGEELSLTAREYDLLCFLPRHPGQAFSRADLMDKVWGWSYGDQSTVTVHVRRLREKVEADPAQPVRLATVWGVGYRWDAKVPDES